MGAEPSKYGQYIGRLDPWEWPQNGEIMVRNQKNYQNILMSPEIAPKRPPKLAKEDLMNVSDQL